MIQNLKRLPKLLILLILILVSIGITILYSAADGNMHPWAFKQVLLFLIACPVSIIIALLDVKTLYAAAYPAYFVALILLIFVEILGHTAMGATRWLELGGIKLQPSEPAKFAIILMLARYFHDKSLKDLSKWSTLFIPTAATLLICSLIIKQPDLGTAILTLISSATLFFVSGIERKKILQVCSLVILCLPICWNLLYEYQRQRVYTFLKPESDPLGSGYNIIQSKIAIGSGGFLGKGFMQGTQSHLSFLPEYQTDFIFAFLAEEFGFVGGFLLIILFMMLIGYIINISISCKSVFLKLTTQGIASIIFAHTFINISMVMGLLPAVGIPLPFISYGGTMIVSMMIGIGFVFNASLNKSARIN